ncbi:MAG TPA: lytic transglycosylase domain-containing protein, partial [Chitinophagaceae bacterium]
ATHYIMEGNGGVTTVTKDEAKDLEFSSNKTSLTNEELSHSKTQPISGKYRSLIISKYVSMDIAGFNHYNPDFDRQIALTGTFELRLPADKMDRFNSLKNQILEESMQLLLEPVNTSNK